MFVRSFVKKIKITVVLFAAHRCDLNSKKNPVEVDVERFNNITETNFIVCSERNLILLKDRNITSDFVWRYLLFETFFGSL